MTKNYDKCVIRGDSSGLLRWLVQSYKLGYPVESIGRVYFLYRSFKLPFEGCQNCSGQRRHTFTTLSLRTHFSLHVVRQNHIKRIERERSLLKILKPHVEEGESPSRLPAILQSTYTPRLTRPDGFVSEFSADSCPDGCIRARNSLPRPGQRTRALRVFAVKTSQRLLRPTPRRAASARR